MKPPDNDVSSGAPGVKAQHAVAINKATDWLSSEAWRTYTRTHTHNNRKWTGSHNKGLRNSFGPMYQMEKQAVFTQQASRSKAGFYS